ncbi:RagB/SusD family nutrient uptake outer membrane protein [Pedobacter sp. MC2016-14]|uniref:RagB/SusD family nutrient uptake outer membrane protein n=1 Tax=Pedobacter sp. MC2016-14 TaxID=2897327 RepID=UPI001E35F164|nr:RagB/SusD family nutrient uptake outer membrane protein [Pedobacter sp. MC2016-14]MCD0490080.1 RagB/SusD family nutrient uptake outer membrane protein [Pedobacter sp. MC2016-14]
MKIKYLYIAFVFLSLGSCKKFLDIVPKDKFIPSTVEDYENMLNYATVSTYGDYFEDLITDDAFLPEGQPGNLYTKQRLSARKIYTFNKDVYGEGDNDILWSEGYKRIFYFNTVANNIMKAQGSTEAEKRSIRAEALLGRALEHLMLVNVYGKHYDAATAGTDPGAPLVLEADISAKNSRNTVQEVYNQVIADAEEAVKDLPLKNKISKFRACKAGGYAFLSRVYLFMGDYANALKNADLALGLQNELANMNGYNVIVPGPFPNDPNIPGAPLGWTNIPNAERHPESLVARTNLRPFGLGMDVCATPELTSLFSNNDRRWALYFANAWPPAPPFNYMDRYGVKIFLRGDYYNNCLAVPEVYLNRAECKARANNLSGALADINKLRLNRIVPAAYHEFTPADFNNDSERVLRFVLEERRRELVFTGMRVIDLKRLNKETRFQKTITHVAEGVTYTLTPNSPNYLRQIWPAASVFNPDWTLNP